MNSVLALTIFCLILALGDIISIRTKSVISTMLVALVLLLIGFWTRLPKTFFEDAGLIQIGRILVPFLITHMGTLLNLSDLKKEWRTVVISLLAVAGIAGSLLILGIPLLGREYAISAAPPISGGVVAALMIGETASKMGMPHIFVFTTLLVVVQQFFGIPIASLLLNREARNYLEAHKEEINLSQAQESAVVTERKRLIPALPKKYQTPYILLAKLGLVVVLSQKISQLTGGRLNIVIICLFLGVILKEVGFLEEGILNKSNSFGIGMVALISVVFNSLSEASPEVLVSLVLPLVGSLLISILGIVLVCGLVGRFFNYSKEMSIAIGVSALFGFPGTFILSSEVANSVGRNQKERQALLDHILPKILVAGFVTVTLASVVLAGIMEKML